MTTRRNALALIESLAQEEQALMGQGFLAPLVAGGRARLRLRGLVYELRVEHCRPGWWRCQMLDARRATIVSEAMPWERGAYLALWPARRLVLLAPIGGMAWLALPYGAEPNIADDLLTVQLVDGGQPFERIVGRVEGSTVWYDDIDRRADPRIAEELRNAHAAGRADPGIAGLGAGERMAYELLAAGEPPPESAEPMAWVPPAPAQHNMASQPVPRETRAAFEWRLRYALRLADARLIGYEQTNGGLRVTWERNRQRGVTLVSRNLDVVSAGICLSGLDDRFDLTSIVGVVQASPAYGYTDWDEEL